MPPKCDNKCCIFFIFMAKICREVSFHIFFVGVGGPKGISRNDPILQGSNDLSCSLCKTVMELVDQAITDEANEQAVIFL